MQIREGELRKMKKMNRLLFFIILLFGMLFCVGNIYLAKTTFREEGRIDKVSVNRIEKALQQYEKDYGTAPKDLAQLEAAFGAVYDGIESISFVSADATSQALSDFFNADLRDDSDYKMIATERFYYAVEYRVNAGDNRQIIILFNILAVFAFFCVLAFWFYMRNKVLKPFYQLSEVPFELSKGNLSIPLQENKDKLFGRFIWGMDLLRENLEENRTKELELQWEKKMLLLSLSHDIKTPLSAIKLYAKALSRNLYKEEAKKLEIAGNIDEKVDEIEGYISDIVKASSEDFLHFEVENGEFYIKDVLEQIREYYEDKMQLNQIAFDMADYRNCLVYGDQDRFVEVLQNIIENAIKYGDGKHIWLEMVREEEEFIIRIFNTGCRLEDKELPHVFDSFFRGSNVEKKPGSGLGLYICRQLMHLMEGEITAAVTTKDEDCIMMVQVAVRLA
ncbi:MAG: HAMP domain-containing histidine kinase [Lachnospiraceae bacterium]|nr:HAMP domain-containing histidine kinase [Lachnospiraceae bacterium]